MPRPLAAAVVADLLDLIRSDFYAGRDRQWHAERARLIAAITWLADWFASRGVSPTLDRYREILQTVFGEARAHASGPIRSPALYLHRCIQTHMQHRGDAYYEQAKTIRRLADISLARLTASQRQAVDSSRQTASLADIYAELSTRTHRASRPPRANRKP